MEGEVIGQGFQEDAVTILLNDLRAALFGLKLSQTPVIAHASLKAFGDVNGGADSIMRAVLDSVGALVMPAFTYQTMITPEVGPPNNGLQYGGEHDLNRMAVPFTRQMPADKQMGMVA